MKQTPDRGMVMNPSRDVCKIDAYPDADFAGMYGHEEHTDPAPTVGLDSSSLLQIVLSFGNPSYKQRWLYRQWKPKIIALSACCRELFHNGHG